MNLQDRLQLAPTFMDFIKQYDHDDIVTIREYGCEGGISDMIYYQDTTDIYNHYCEDLHDLLQLNYEAADEFPEYITRELGNASTFKNAVVWLCAEITAGDILANQEREQRLKVVEV